MLPSLNLDYCRPPLPLPRAGWVLLAAGVLVLAASSAWTWRVQAQLAAAETQLRVLERSAAGAARAPARRIEASRGEALEVGRANALLRSLDVPWDDLFRAIEASAHEEIALLQLQPDPQKATVRITAEAKDFAALVAYSAELARRKPIGGVLLQSHEQDPRGTSVRFTLVARWKADES